MAKLSVIIPSRGERFLEQTIYDVLAKARGDIEVIVGLCGPAARAFEKPVTDPRVQFFDLAVGDTSQMRHMVNVGAKLSTGDYLMKLDAHCLLADGFDDVLIRDHQPNWVQSLERRRLDAENWCELADDRPPVQAEYLMWRPLRVKHELHGYRWDAEVRAHVPEGDTLSFQGSCWFMTKEWFRVCGFMQTEGYGGFFGEPEEIMFRTRKLAGDVKVNRNTWYAHLHKGKQYGRGWSVNRVEQSQSYEFVFQVWVRQHWALFCDIIDRFMPIPGWPEDWKRKLAVSHG